MERTKCLGSGERGHACVSCYVIVLGQVHLPLVSDSLRTVIQAGPTNPDCLLCAGSQGCGWYCQKGVSFMFEINFLSTVNDTCDNSLPPAALHIRELVINEMGSRGQLRWPHRGPRAAQESPPLPRLANVPVCGHS